MLIDQTRYDAFWRNPEAYRITYERNLVPVEMSYGLARGSALHRIAELSHAGKSDAEINAALRDEGLSEKAIRMAWVLWGEFTGRYGNDRSIEVVATELEFVVPIPGSPHAMAGRVDEILRVNGQLWCGELKTANERAQYDRTRNDWEQKKQADFEILGARSLGYDVQGVLVRVLKEGTPPVIWPFNVTRSPHQLSVTQLNVHQTCEIIEFMRRTFGTQMPWPHVPLNWPCSMPDKCEYASICQQDADNWTPEDLAHYKEREEHLGVIADAVSSTPA